MSPFHWLNRIESFDIPLVNEDSTLEKVITLCEGISSINRLIVKNIEKLDSINQMIEKMLPSTPPPRRDHIPTINTPKKGFTYSEKS